MPQPKDIDWLNGYKNQDSYAAYKRLTWDLKTQTDWKWYEWNRMKMIFYANGNEKKAGVSLIISCQINFKTKTVTKEKEGHYIMIKVSIQQKGTICVNIYAPKTAPLKHIEQMLANIKGEFDIE